MERDVLAACMKWLNKQPHIWAWRRNVGLHQVNGRWYRVGLKGQSDIYGIVTVETDAGEVGVHLEVEVKRKGLKPNKDQLAYLTAVMTHGGIAVWADSVTMLDAKLRASFSHRGWTWP